MSGLQQSIQQIVNQQNSKIIKSDELSSYSIDLTNRFLFTLDEEGRYHSYNDEPAIVYMDTDIYIWMEHGKIQNRNEYNYSIKCKSKPCDYNYELKYIKGFRYCEIKQIYAQKYINDNKDLCLSLKLLFISNIYNNRYFSLYNRFITDFKYNESLDIPDLHYINQKSKIIFNTIAYINSLFISNDTHFTGGNNNIAIIIHPLNHGNYKEIIDNEVYKYSNEMNCKIAIFNNYIIEKFNLDLINKISLFITNFINTNRYINDLCKINNIDKKDILNKWKYILKFDNFNKLINDIYYQECINSFKKDGYKKIIMTLKTNNITLNDIKDETIYNKEDIDNIYKMLVSTFEYDKINDYTLINFEKNCNYLISNNYYIIKENDNNIISYCNYKCDNCCNFLENIKIYSNRNVHRIYCKYCDDIYEYKGKFV